MVTQPTRSRAPLPGAPPPSADSRCLKVAFIGSHGVGKTTLCFDLAARLKRMDYRVDMVKEVARRCPLPINKDTTVEAQAWILHTQMAVEIETAWEHDIIVCDRSVVDNYAYLVERFGRHPAYDPMVESWLQTYDRLIWVPILENPRFDGIRDTDRAYQWRIEETLEELAKEFSLSPVRLHGVDRDTWVDLTLSRLPLGSTQLPLFGEE
jgi:nicotinamide riboside kinase